MSAWLIAILDMQQCGTKQRAPGQDIVCLTPTTQGISLMWTDPYGQIDSLCLQRCWIFHWLLSARQRWVKSLLAVIVLQPQFWLNLRAIQARWQRPAEITNAWGNKVVEENWLLSVFHYSPSICQTSQISRIQGTCQSVIWHTSNIHHLQSGDSVTSMATKKHNLCSSADSTAHPVLLKCNIAGW